SLARCGNPPQGCGFLPVWLRGLFSAPVRICWGRRVWCMVFPLFGPCCCPLPSVFVSACCCCGGWGDDLLPRCRRWGALVPILWQYNHATLGPDVVPAAAGFTKLAPQIAQTQRQCRYGREYASQPGCGCVYGVAIEGFEAQTPGFHPQSLASFY